MLSYIPSFYLLQRLSSEPWSQQTVARVSFETLADSMATCFRDYLFMACMGESRHAMNKTGVGFDGFSGKERDEVYKFSSKYAISPENIQALVDIFDGDRWGKKPGYGGKKWKDLAEVIAQYEKLSSVMFVDAVVNAQHNGGTAFSKSEATSHMDIDFNIHLNTLQNFLNFRRISPDILHGFTAYFTRVSLTSGKLAIAHSIECHSPLEVNKLSPLPDHVYTPVKWGKLKLPKVVKMMRSCYSCGKSFEDTKRCPNCGRVLCFKCYGDEEYCSACRDDYVYRGRCSVCLQEMNKENSIKVSCGNYVHTYCVNHHRTRCSTCYQSQPESGLSFYNDTCFYCGLPINSDLEHWTDYHGHYCHQHCFHLVRTDGEPKGDYKSSKKLFDEIAVLCPLCGKPVLKEEAVPGPGCQHHSSSVACHYHCVMLHKIDCSTSTLCDCHEYTLEQGVWKSIKKEIGKESHVKAQQKQK